MRRTVDRECSRRYEGVTHAAKRIPVGYSQRHIRVLRRPRWLQAIRVNQEDVASGGSDQDEWYVPCCLPHG
jgi:hypothetical protein